MRMRLLVAMLLCASAFAQTPIPGPFVTGSQVNGSGNLTNANAVTCTASAGVLKECTSAATIPGVTIAGATIAPSVQPASDSTTAFRIFKADGSTAVLTVDTTNSITNIANRAAVGQATIGGNSLLTSTVNGTLELQNNTATAGVFLDFSTDATAKFRNRANNADAAITASTLTSVGVINSSGTAFTVSGCATVSAITGGATAGSFSTTTTGTCTAAITMNGATGLSAPHGWSCHASDITAGHLVEFTQTATSTTGCTVQGATTSGDTIVFSAIGY